MKTNVIETKLGQPKDRQANISIEIETITAAIAEKYLKLTAPHQRGIKSWSKAKITNDMKEVVWWFNGDPIVFNEDGYLVNGQHRLTGLISSLVKSLPFVVIRGVLREAYISIDCGVAKSVGDYFKFIEVANSNAAASTARWILRYLESKDGQILHQSIARRTDIELKETYYRQASQNLRIAVENGTHQELF